MSKENVQKIKILTDYITLGQLLKLANIISCGGEAKSFIARNSIFVNAEECKQRGKKLRERDQVNIINELFFEITRWFLKK